MICCVGMLCVVWCRDGGSGVHSQWWVERVEVVVRATGGRTSFPYGSWLERGGSAVLSAGDSDQVGLWHGA